jgi:hypothetical protein
MIWDQIPYKKMPRQPEFHLQKLETLASRRIDVSGNFLVNWRLRQVLEGSSATAHRVLTPAMHWNSRPTHWELEEKGSPSQAIAKPVRVAEDHLLRMPWAIAMLFFKNLTEPWTGAQCSRRQCAHRSSHGAAMVSGHATVFLHAHTGLGCIISRPLIHERTTISQPSTGALWPNGDGVVSMVHRFFVKKIIPNSGKFLAFCKEAPAFLSNQFWLSF